MKRLILTLLATLATVAGAHAELAASQPETGAVLETAPAQVLLEFTEPLEAGFSLFQVHRLDADIDLTAADALQRLNGLAAVLVGEALDSREDSNARVDTGTEPASGAVSEITLALQDDLPPGHYVVMWRAMSVDTHPVQGFTVFSVKTTD